MDTIMNYLDAHPYVFLDLVAFVFIFIVSIYLSIVGWCVHTVQNPNSGFFKKRSCCNDWDASFKKCNGHDLWTRSG